MGSSAAACCQHITSGCTAGSSPAADPTHTGSVQPATRNKASAVREQMSRDKSKVCVGSIAGAHGVKGEVRVKSFTLIPEDCFAYGPLLDDAGNVLLEPKSAKPAKAHFIVVAKGSNRTRED